MRQLSFDKFLETKGHKAQTQICAMLSSAECFNSSQIKRTCDSFLNDNKESKESLFELLACIMYKMTWFLSNNYALNTFGKELADEYYELYKSLFNEVGRSINDVMPSEYQDIVAEVGKLYETK